MYEFLKKIFGSFEKEDLSYHKGTIDFRCVWNGLNVGFVYIDDGWMYVIDPWAGIDGVEYTYQLIGCEWVYKGSREA